METDSKMTKHYTDSEIDKFLDMGFPGDKSGLEETYSDVIRQLRKQLKLRNNAIRAAVPWVDQLIDFEHEDFVVIEKIADVKTLLAKLQGFVS